MANLLPNAWHLRANPADRYKATSLDGSQLSDWRLFNTHFLPAPTARWNVQWTMAPARRNRLKLDFATAEPMVNEASTLRRRVPAATLDLHGVNGYVTPMLVRQVRLDY